MNVSVCVGVEFCSACCCLVSRECVCNACVGGLVCGGWSVLVVLLSVWVSRIVLFKLFLGF